MREKDIYRRLGQTLAARRNGMGKTQLELARAVGISRASLANIERGEQRVYIHHALALAAALETKLTELIPTVESYTPLQRANVSVSGDKVNRAQARAIKELVSAITASARKIL